MSVLKNYAILPEKSILPNKWELKQHAINGIKMKIQELPGITMTDKKLTKNKKIWRKIEKQELSKIKMGTKSLFLKTGNRIYLEGEPNTTIKKLKGKYTF